VVTLDGQPVTRLNELECVGSLVYANVWQTNDILEIDPGTGVVSAVIDATPLTMRAMELASSDMDVLNGIAFDPSDGNFLVTGKLWPAIFEVDFEPAAAAGVEGDEG
jgi:glutamine cyclotransferase